MKPFARELQLYGYLNSPTLLTMTLPTPYTFKILPNVRSLQMLKKTIQICEDFESAFQIPKIKC